MLNLSKRVACALSMVAACLSQTVFAQDISQPPDGLMPLRIALPQFPGNGDCQAANKISIPGASHYAAHISSRFDNPIYLCLGGDMDSAARAVASGDREMAWINQRAYVPVANDVRAIMTLRNSDNIARVPVTILAHEDQVAGYKTPETIETDPQIGFLSMRPVILHKDRVFSVLDQWGAKEGWLEAAKGYESFPALREALRSGEVD
ncbi:MAG: hypothetical protein AAFP97_09500, partial [Pseudomonadota bacterium]